jgi:BirA family biotin operon repressor/biotin-[acetyl-CoA-carboxylase] ligase
MRGMALQSEFIAALRRPDAHPVTIEGVAETGSTNADLLARIDALAGPLLLVAENQTAGRGRAGRTWHASPEASLTFSLAWKFARPIHGLTGLPLAVGVVISETLMPFGLDASLKWPNDVLLDGRKLAGVLIETAARRDEGTWAVIGIGVNLAMPESLAARIGSPVAAFGAPVDRHALMAALLDGLCDMLAVFDAEGFAPFTERWNNRHAHAGLGVAIIDHGRNLHEGIAGGVDDNGCLLLDTEQGRIVVTAGDVSLRALVSENIS